MTLGPPRGYLPYSLNGKGARMAENGKRFAYIDNLRVFLTVLVVLQHAARAYGTSIWWFVADKPLPGIERFTAVNSSFFMSLFFFVSFFFLPASYDRKGFLGFHRDRFRRLFLPLAFFAAVVSPAMMYWYYVTSRGYGFLSFPAYFLDVYLGLGGKPALWSGPAWPDLNFGPLWFVEQLIVYGILYSLFRLATRKIALWKRSLSFPSNGKILALAIFLGLAAFAVRIEYPLYRWIGILGFIQSEPAHLPFYLAMFFLGIVAYRNEWLSKLPGKAGNLWLTVGVVAAAAIAFHPTEPRFYGGLSAYSLEYSLCEAFACVGLVFGLPYWFWRRFDERGAFMRSLSASSYAVYIVHLPVVVAVQAVLAMAELDPGLKFALVCLVSVPAAFGLAWLLRKIPWVRDNV
jgi:glucans biosynthesis protein C